MIHVSFTHNMQRHVRCPRCQVNGATVREVLDSVFAENPAARPYVLDDQGALRRHMQIFVNGRAIHDRQKLGDAVPLEAEIHIMQALSGG